MSVILTSGSTQTYLPNPAFSDTAGTPHELNIKRSMTGVRRVYKKVAQTRRLNYNFRLTKPKALELRAFVEAYYDSEITLTNHKGETWLVKFVNQPFNFSATDRAKDVPGGEMVSVPLSFEGVQQ